MSIDLRQILRPSFCAAALLFASLALAPRAEAQRAGGGDMERIQLELGEQRTIPAEHVTSYSVGAEGIVDVRLNERPLQFILVAIRPGVTSLLLIYEDGRQVRYQITVLDPDATVTATGGVQVRENIRLDLYFVQLTESYSHQVGIGFPGSIGGNGVGRFAMTIDLTSLDTTPIQEATASIINQALPRIDLAQSMGWARMMRQAMLVTANGEQASINAGGEANLVVAGGFGGSIQRIEFGSLIEMTPRYDPTTHRIEVSIATDISDLTPPLSDGGAPGRTRTRLTTVVNLELGQSIVLGGLTSRTTQQSSSGLPWLSQIPIVGVLFGSNFRREENVESFLFVVPTVVQAIPRARQDRIAEALRVYEDFGSIGGHGLGDIQLIEPSPPGYE